jgi:hypothetical protein
VSRYRNPKEFRIKQTIFLQIKAYRILFKFIQEGKIIFEILQDITLKREKAGSPYRMDIYDTACQIFRYCHLILIMFCEGNPDNQAILVEYLPLFITNTFINFG